MEYSLISRHLIQGFNHFVGYLSHDIFLVLFLVSLSFQLSYTSLYFHHVNGILILWLSMFLFISGLYLSFYTSFTIVFQSYGLSFIVLCFDTCGLVFNYELIHASSCFYSLYMLHQSPQDFFWALWFVPFIHITLADTYLVGLRRHKYAARCFSIVCLIGTLFSFVHDEYWLRSKELVYKNIIQQGCFILWIIAYAMM